MYSWWTVLKKDKNSTMSREFSETVIGAATVTFAQDAVVVSVLLGLIIPEGKNAHAKTKKTRKTN